MKIKILLLLSLFTILVSCSNHQFSQFDTFGEDNHWLQTDVKTFEFEITDDSKPYDVVFKFSHVYDFQFPTVPINFSIESPDGTKEDILVEMALKGKDGKDLGDCSGDVCDMDYPIKTKAKLTKGKYKIIVSHNFKGAPYLPNIIGVGLYVDSVK